MLKEKEMYQVALKAVQWLMSMPKESPNQSVFAAGAFECWLSQAPKSDELATSLISALKYLQNAEARIVRLQQIDTANMEVMTKRIEKLVTELKNCQLTSKKDGMETKAL